MSYKQKGMKFGQGTGDVDLTKKTGLGPKAEKKNTYNEAEEQTIENMSNAKDNNFDGHTEIKINKNKKKPLTQEQKEDAKGVGSGSNRKVMKDGVKNKTHGAGDTGNWQPHQFKK